jgi:hypothetical protein
MKGKYIIIILLLFNIIQNVNNKNSNTTEKKRKRLLLDLDINYDSSNREGKDKESIEICQNSDYKYFINYISGYNITFDKDIEQDGAVRM